MSKKLKAFIILLSFIFATYIYLVQKRSSSLEVDFLDVGQGDSVLIKLPDRRLVLIDGGPDNLVLRRLGENLGYFQRRIDLVISSHYHDDHATGLIEISRRYRVKQLAYQANSQEGMIFAALLAVAKKTGTSLIPLKNAVKIDFSPGCRLTLWPASFFLEKADPNNSVISKLDCAGQSFLFSGDNSAKVEKAMLASNENWQADVLKASHHGSNSANSQAFLETVDPRLVVIPVGKDNRFGHPSPLVLERLKSLKIKEKRTDLAGTIKVSPPY